MHRCLWGSSLNMFKPSQSVLDKLFFNWCYPGLS
uniref:Uncharacterized protein n=1 Tax=Arundo donax TaxID=35708 RepID=A0A0A9CEN2_ARUDO